MSEGMEEAGEPCLRSLSPDAVGVGGGGRFSHSL